ncbi:beta-1 adrenergic receptor-like [Patiria miniata]|uniref:G-protein coupled receptors family 1 profile domain-containing protein n=1 Tax=Patiria miniata TaxID=46514 RepID=A0A913ZQL8_PATMI|nr:beta-1 adrenergic receptor-like [Patiria miniata]
MNIHMNSTGRSEDLSTFNASTTPTTEDRNEYNFIRCILLVITTILLLTLNPLCLVVLRHVRSIQETTKIFLRSMTIADLGMGLFQALPMTVLAISETEHIGEVFCQVLSFAGEIFIYGPQMSILLLTVDRYISVVYALRYPSLVTVKRARISVCLLLFTYVLPVLTNSWLNVLIYYLRNQDCRRVTHDLLISNYRSCKRCLPLVAN